jgi:hypothetical protein
MCGCRWLWCVCPWWRCGSVRLCSGCAESSRCGVYSLVAVCVRDCVHVCLCMRLCNVFVGVCRCVCAWLWYMSVCACETRSCASVRICVCVCVLVCVLWVSARARVSLSLSLCVCVCVCVRAWWCVSGWVHRCVWWEQMQGSWRRQRRKVCHHRFLVCMRARV